MSSPSKTRQVDLGMQALAERMGSSMPDPGADKVWSNWLCTDPFGGRSDDWKSMAKHTGRAMARSGWPGVNSPAMEAFLVWARSKRGVGIGSFYEDAFIREALAAGWKSEGINPLACHWAQRMEDARLVHVASLTKSRGSERLGGLGAKVVLGAARGPVEKWKEAAQSCPSAIAYLYGAAVAACGEPAYRRTKSESAHELDLDRLSALAELMSPQERQDNLAGLFKSERFVHMGGYEQEKISAEIARKLLDLGADWLGPTKDPNSKEIRTVIAQAFAFKNFEASQVALADLGPEVFWPLARESWMKSYKAKIVEYEGGAVSTERLGDLARSDYLWLARFESPDPELARFVLGYASMTPSDKEGLAEMAEAFSSLGPKARLSDGSAWNFAGFNGNYSPSLSVGSEIDPQLWAMRKSSALREMERDGVNSVLGCLVSNLALHGCPPPWKDGAMPKGLGPKTQSFFERWTLAAAAPVDQKTEIGSRSGSLRM